jgi:hypothetical protein
MPKLTEGTYALGALTVFSLWLFVGLPYMYWPREIPLQQPIHSSGPPPQGIAIEPKGTPQAPLFIQVLPGPDASERADHEAEDRSAKQVADWVLGAATIGLMIATIVLGLIAGRQLIDSNLAHKISNRAYLSVEPDGLDPPFGEFEGHKVIGHIRVRNVGHVPARSVSWFKAIELSDDGERSNFPIGEKFEGDNVILPATEMTQGTAGLVWQGNTQFVYVWGELRYRDGFGRPCFTRFCHRYNRSTLIKLPNRQHHGVEAKYGRFHEHGNDAETDDISLSRSA